MDNLTLLVLIGAAIGVAVFVLMRKKAENPAETLPERKRSRSTQRSETRQQSLDLDPQTRFIDTPKRKQYRLLNDSEQELYHRLSEAMPNMRVFAQVGVAQLALARGRQEAQRLGRMAGRGVDFVVCDQEFAIVAAIELAWPTTAAQEGEGAEDEKRMALQSLGIPLIVFRPNMLPDAETISHEIADAIIRRNRMEAERH
ncbi:MAG: DUF2726 domain-containing protein [Azonexus sp.]|nr:DUF2726 domain-containing protein [Azonexus sp.]